MDYFANLLSLCVVMGVLITQRAASLDSPKPYYHVTGYKI